MPDATKPDSLSSPERGGKLACISHNACARDPTGLPTDTLANQLFGWAEPGEVLRDVPKCEARSIAIICGIEFTAARRFLRSN